MKELKIGDTVKIESLPYSYRGNHKVGDHAVIVDHEWSCKPWKTLSGDEDVVCKFVLTSGLSKVKWTIYNNDKPWSDLSDKQKQKLLSAYNHGLKFKGFACNSYTLPFEHPLMTGSIFTAVKPEKVKPAQTMAKMFHFDFYRLNGGQTEIAKQMIAKGWVKK
tara:strand:+ start:77 stop:562 length:486 start_codon:yes stop_codon:yes gene_type:complete